MENVLVTSMSEDDLRWFIAHPDIMFSSDGELHGTHPRGAGAFPRILGRYVRDEKVLPLAAAVHKMSGLPATRLGLKDRGRIAPGYVADLVVFDPAKVIDGSTVQNPEAPPLGIPDVMVAGQWVVRDGKPTGARPGRVLRRTAYQR
jgi:N-acyl-D-aspartate/D-glutamate deacylase